MKIIISGPAEALDIYGIHITDIAQLERISGLEYADEVCATYLDETLGAIGIEGGTLLISLDQKSRSLRVVTEYRLPRKLRKLEISALVEHTKGQ